MKNGYDLPKNSINQKYLEKYGNSIKKFGEYLSLGQPGQFIFYPAVGGDLHNILLLTEDSEAPILMTDQVSFNVEAVRSIYEEEEWNDSDDNNEEECDNSVFQRESRFMLFRGNRDAAKSHRMHQYFSNRLSSMHYQIIQQEKNIEGLVHLRIEKRGLTRDLYYMQTNHFEDENNSKLISIMKKLLNQYPEKQWVYFQKAFVPSVSKTEVYRNFIRKIENAFPSSRFLVDGDVAEYADILCSFGFHEIHKDETFCYLNTMSLVSRIKSESDLISEYHQKNPRVLEKIQELENRLRTLFEADEAQLLKMCKSYQYLEIEVFLQTGRPDLEKYDTLLSYMPKLKEYVYFLALIYKEFNTSVKTIVETKQTLLIKNTVVKTDPMIVWGRIGLAQEYTTQFHHPDVFRNSEESLLSIYQTLKSLEEQLGSVKEKSLKIR